MDNIANVIAGTEQYIGAKAKRMPRAEAAGGMEYVASWRKGA